MREYFTRLFCKRTYVRLAVYTAIILMTVAVIVCNNIPSIAVKLAPINEFFIRLVGTITSFVPFSVLGLTIVLIVPIVIAIIVFFVLSKHKLKYFINLVCVVCVLVSMFYCTIGFNYSKESVYSTIKLDTSVAEDKELLVEAVEYFLNKTNETVNQIDFVDGHSVMSMSYQQMSDEILRSYKDLEIFDFLYDFDLRPKKFFPADIMNYAGITGIFFPFYAEINVCGNMPDKEMPTTTAHEIAHSKGIMDEGEANFIAEIVCINCDNPYIQYVGYSTSLNRLLSQLSSVDADLQVVYYQMIDPKVRSDNNYNYEFFHQFQGPVSETVTKVNDNYLKENNVESGVVSYSEAVKGIIAYYNEYLK